MKKSATAELAYALLVDITQGTRVLSQRAVKALIHAKVFTRKDLLSMNPWDLKQKNIGDKTIHEITLLIIEVAKQEYRK